MSIFQSIILGAVQGLTEFLPISSSAHLIIFPWFLHWPDPGLSFDVALHVGTLLAVVAYFWRDWIEIFRKAIGIRINKDKNRDRNRDENKNGVGDKLLWFLIVATIPGAAVGWLLEEKAETVLRAPLLIAATLAGLGIILWLADRWSLKKKNLKQMNWLDSILIGLAQALAIIPGISRSGVTMSAGLMREYSRETAARFSFLLATPIILGSAVFKAKDLLGVGGIDIHFIIGIITSAIIGFLAIRFLLKFLEKNSFALFVWYRIVLAIIIGIVWMLR